MGNKASIEIQIHWDESDGGESSVESLVDSGNSVVSSFSFIIR